MALIRLEGIGQSFGKREVLRDVDLEIREGEVFSIIGPTGAGKTTLLRIMGLLDRPFRGKVFFAQREIDSEAQKLWARRRMAFVMQRPRLFTGTVLYNLKCGLKWRGMWGREARRRCSEVLELLGLGGYEERDTRTLSGGEAQRVAIARALVLDPQVLILDEPTSDLDPRSVAKVEEIISGLKGRMTVVLSTHSMLQAQRLSDRMGVLLEGRLVQVGTPREVFWMPKDEDVALFVGVDNLIEGVLEHQDRGLAVVKVEGGEVQAISDLPVGQKVWVCLRPEDIILSLTLGESSARNRFRGRIAALYPFGPFVRVEVDCGPRLKVLITAASAEEMGLEVGQEVYCSFKATAVHLIPRG